MFDTALLVIAGLTILQAAYLVDVIASVKKERAVASAHAVVLASAVLACGIVLIRHVPH